MSADPRSPAETTTVDDHRTRVAQAMEPHKPLLLGFYMNVLLWRKPAWSTAFNGGVLGVVWLYFHSSSLISFVGSCGFVFVVSDLALARWKEPLVNKLSTVDPSSSTDRDPNPPKFDDCVEVTYQCARAAKAVRVVATRWYRTRHDNLFLYAFTATVMFVVFQFLRHILKAHVVYLLTVVLIQLPAIRYYNLLHYAPRRALPVLRSTWHRIARIPKVAEIVNGLSEHVRRNSQIDVSGFQPLTTPMMPTPLRGQRDLLDNLSTPTSPVTASSSAASSRDLIEELLDNEITELLGNSARDVAASAFPGTGDGDIYGGDHFDSAVGREHAEGIDVNNSSNSNAESFSDYEIVNPNDEA